MEPYRDPESQALVFPADPAITEVEILKIRVEKLKEVGIYLCSVLSGYTAGDPHYQREITRIKKDFENI